jgi:hypothetical protein
MVTTSSPNSPRSVNAEHRGWKLQARWLTSISPPSEGWACYVTRPGSPQGLNIGRWPTSELALEQGRAYVDAKVDLAAQTTPKPQSS